MRPAMGSLMGASQVVTKAGVNGHQAETAKPDGDIDEIKHVLLLLIDRSLRWRDRHKVSIGNLGSRYKGGIKRGRGRDHEQRGGCDAGLGSNASGLARLRVYSAATLSPYPSCAFSFSTRSAAASGMLVPGPKTALAPMRNNSS